MSDKVLGFSNWWGSVFVAKIATPIGVAFFLGGTGLAMLEVFRRYVVGVSFMWQQDIVVMMLLMGMTIFFTVAQWDRAHISVTAVAEFLARKPTPRKMRAIEMMKAVGDIWTGVFVVLLLYWGIPLIFEYKDLGIRLQSQLTEYWPFFAVFVLALAPMALTDFLHAYQGIRKTALGGPGEEEGTA